MRFSTVVSHMFSGFSLMAAVLPFGCTADPAGGTVVDLKNGERLLSPEMISLFYSCPVEFPDL